MSSIFDAITVFIRIAQLHSPRAEAITQVRDEMPRLVAFNNDNLFPI